MTVRGSGGTAPGVAVIHAQHLHIQPTNGRQRSRVPLWLLGVFALCFVYFFPSPVGPNEAAHLDLTQAIVDHGSLRIDAYHTNTIDLAFFQGHYYANKAPGQSLLGVPIYFAFKTIFQPVPAFTSQQAPLSYYLLVYVESIFTVAIPALLLLMLFFWFLDFFSNSLAHRAVLTLALGLATDVFRYANTVYSHVPSAVALFAAFILVWIQGRDDVMDRGRSGWLPRHPQIATGFAGILLGVSVVLEYPSALVAVLIGLYALSSLPRRLWPYLILGAVPGLLLIGAYNLAIYHNPLVTGYASSASAYPGVHRTHSGLAGAYQHVFGALRLRALLGMSFHPYRGLFFLSPFLLLSFPGYWLWARRGGREWFLFLVVPVFLFLAISTFAGWYGGQAVGPRYLIVSLPFLVFPAIFVLDRVEAWAARLVVYGLFGLSFAATWIESVGGEAYPYINLANPLFDYSLPALERGHLNANLVTLLVVVDPSIPIKSAMITPVATIFLITLLALWSLWGLHRPTIPG